MNLFEQAQQDRQEKDGPLAARMRPRTLEEYIGQEHIVGPGRLLRRAIQADQLGSIILYGPPGTGKTTLAKVISNSTNSHFITLNAVFAGVKDIREAVADAQERANLYGQRTTLFIDEVHRFNKAQQDALLPWVENGVVLFIGATTENPYFEVNKALVSRSRIFQLLPLQAEHIRKIILQALHNDARGYGKLNVQMDEDALAHLVNVANGDARAALNALELAVVTSAPPSAQAADTPIHITLEIAEESIQQRAVLYDKEGDYHFDYISAFIKSLRGSDPDAALYWMAKIVSGGESPRFLFRRMIIFAGEDIGMADPNAIRVVMACAQAFDYVGLPEGRFHLAEAAIYLATAPKSNSALAFFDAIAQVQKESDSGVPNHLRDANRDKEGFGHGQGYLYPHAYRDHWVAQQYLPISLQGKIFYQPSDQGYEARIRNDVARKREEQLAAMLAQEVNSPGHDPAGVGIEILTFSPDDPERERWLQRTVSSAGAQLGQLRDRVIQGARLSRHSLVLDLKAGSGLLTWEALRQAPEGGVYALAHAARDAEALRQMAAQLKELERPFVLQGTPAQLAELLAADGVLPQRFDALVGHNVLLEQPDKAVFVHRLCKYLLPHGRLSLAERISQQNQRLYNLLNLAELESDLAGRVEQAEEAIYADPADPLVNWDSQTLIKGLEEQGITAMHQVEKESQPLQVTEALLTRWFTPSSGGRPSYAQRLLSQLTPAEVERVAALFKRQLLNQTVVWHAQTLYLQIESSERK